MRIAADLTSYADTTRTLLQHAGEVHSLVVARVDALLAVYDGPDYPAPLESARGYVERVLARGQQPFPRGQSIHDDEGYEQNCNRSYEHVSVGLGPEPRVRYDGSYPVWEEDRLVGTAFAHVSVPSWVITEEDGPSRYRAETESLVAALEKEQSEEMAAVSKILDGVLRDLGEA